MVNIDAISEDTTLLDRRDAFHIPCILAKSNSRLHGGFHVKFIDVDMTTVRLCLANEVYHGIVSPFRNSVILPGQLCWIMLRPVV